MQIHILGIAGKLMGGIALMAQQLGHEVSGSDANIASPMAKQLLAANIPLYEGYEPEHLSDRVDLVIVGNTLSRGNALVEFVLNSNIPYTSGPNWLAEEVFSDKWVIAVSGTHGKTTTTSMVAWVLEQAGLNPGFLIGGTPINFSESSRLTDSPFFVIEADEYDSAFFDKRPKFMHYHPRTLIINNLEFDHADIYDDLAAIQKQFHFLVRTIPSEGLIIIPEKDPAVKQVIDMGSWTPLHTIGQNGDLSYELINKDASALAVVREGKTLGELSWSQIGEHNAKNALAAIAACEHVGVKVEHAVKALSEFTGVERRMQPLGELNGAHVFDDFAHHPTAIKTTLDGLRKSVGGEANIIVILEFGSFSMRNGAYQEQFPHSFEDANQVFLLSQNCQWDVEALAKKITTPNEVHEHVDTMVSALQQAIMPGDYLVIMTNQNSGAISQALGISS